MEEYIRAGRVQVNGEVVHDLGRRIDPSRDRVEVDGVEKSPQEVGQVLVLNKPVGVVSSLVRQDQRPCLLDLVPPQFAATRLFHVGRLDADSSGILLLSDDGDLAQALLHPSRPVWKVYRIDVRPRLEEDKITALANGSIELEGRAVAPARARILVEDRGHCRIEIALREGRNRQLRRMVEAVGARVIQLHRTAFGPIELGSQSAGTIRAATLAEMAQLRELTQGER